MRETGVVVFYDSRKGFGFIERHDGPQVYFQRGALPRHRKWEPDKGDVVSFEVRESEDKGLFASKIDFVPVDGERLAPPTGCIFCDVGLIPMLDNGKLKHHIARRNEWIACVSTEGQSDESQDAGREAAIHPD